MMSKEYFITLNKLFYPDIVDIITEMLYVKCSCCGILEEEEKMYMFVDKEVYCLLCFREFEGDIEKCHNCKLFYEKHKKGLYCSACVSKCKLYCLHCLDDRFKTPILRYNNGNEVN